MVRTGEASVEQNMEHKIKKNKNKKAFFLLPWLEDDFKKERTGTSDGICPYQPLVILPIILKERLRKKKITIRVSF